MTPSQRVQIAVLVLVIAIFHVVQIRPNHGWSDDASLYLRHTINLAKGLPYTHIDYFENPEGGPMDRVYPPLLPLYLVPVYKLWGFNWVAFKIALLVFFVGSLALIPWVYRDWLPFPWLLVIVAMLGFSSN